MQHKRFKRRVWAFKHDFTAALGKWLIRQSPYTVPCNLEACITEFDKRLSASPAFEFDANDMIEIELADLANKINILLETIPEVMALNERVNGREGMGISTRLSPKIEPDDDFICIGAVAQNIVCDFADTADAEAYLAST